MLGDAARERDFVVRGLYVLHLTTLYLASLVDSQATGAYATEDRKKYLGFFGLASVAKAAEQWALYEPDARPEFVIAAEKYLAETPAEWGPCSSVYPASDGNHPEFHPGPIASRKGGRGRASRIVSVNAQKTWIVKRLTALVQEDLHDESTMSKWVLQFVQDFVRELGDAHGDLLREGDFRFSSLETQLRQLAARARSVLSEADVTEDDPEDAAKPKRLLRLTELSEQLISGALDALGVTVPKDYFRDRRG